MTTDFDEFRDRLQEENEESDDPPEHTRDWIDDLVESDDEG